MQKRKNTHSFTYFVLVIASGASSLKFWTVLCGLYQKNKQEAPQKKTPKQTETSTVFVHLCKLPASTIIFSLKQKRHII